MSVITKDLGIASAYGYAKSKGYTGTEEEFAELMASYADVAQQAEAAAQDAEDAKDAAVSAKNDAVTAKTAAQAAQSAAETASGTATTKASEAAQSAQSAAGFASAAQTSATAASGSAQTAQTAAQTATNKASEASSSASAASTAKTGAETARTGAQTAQAAAETAQANAEAAASSVSASAAQIEQNTEDITGLKNDLTNLSEKVDSAFVTETATGAIASFTDGADDVPVKDLTVAIEPVQDLHGQSSPYPGGGGVNKFDPDHPETVTVTYGGSTSTKYGHSYTEAGTYAVNAYSPSEAYIGCIVKYSDDTWSSIDYIVGGGTSASGKVVTLSSGDTLYVFNMLGDNEATSITKFNNNKVQVALSGTQPASFAPYSNICPINGWTGANVTACGINVWDEEWEVGRIDTTTGEPLTLPNGYHSKNFITITGTPLYIKSADGYLYICEYGVSKNYLRYASYFQNEVYTPHADAKYIKFHQVDKTTYNHDISINYPATDTAYHAYNGSSVSVNWQSSAGTVYGGTLDVVSGVLTVTDKAVAIGSLTWQQEATYFFANTSDGNMASSSSETIHAKCSCYKSISQSEGSTSDYAIHGMANIPKRILIRDSSLNDSVSALVEQRGTQTICYRLAEPQTYQLTPQEVSTILGQNNIFADCGDVTVQYRADTKLYIDKVISA